MLSSSLSLGPQSGHFTVGLPTKSLYACLNIPTPNMCPVITVNIFGDEHKSWTSSYYAQCSPDSRYELPLTFQNNYQQDDTFGLSFISGLVVLHSTCFELQRNHHQEFHFFTVQAASGILCNLLLYCTRRGTGAIQQKITQYARGCLYSKKVKLLMMISLKLETCRVKDD